MHGLGKIPLALTVFLLGLGPDRASPTQPAETTWFPSNSPPLRYRRPNVAISRAVRWSPAQPM